jgi:hypothetical protein
MYAAQRRTMKDENNPNPDQAQEMSIADLRAAMSEENPPEEKLEVSPDKQANDLGTDKNESHPASQEKGASPESGQNLEVSGASTQQEQGDGGKSPEGKFKAKEHEDQNAVQKRMNKVIWEKHEADRKREAAEARAAELEAKLAGEKNGQATGKPEDKTPATSFSEPKPVLILPDRGDFDDLGEFLDAQAKAQAEHSEKLSDWLFQKNQFENQQRQQQSDNERKTREAQEQAGNTFREAQKGYLDRVDKSAKDNPKILEAVNGSAGQFLTEAGQAQLIMQSDVGPELVLYVHEHPEEVMQVAKTGDPRQVERFLLRLEGRLAAQKTPAPNPLDTNNEERRTLPEPVTAAGGRTTPNTGIDLNDDKVPLDSWKKEFRRQLDAGL